ncbi:hypothetical protein D3C85_1016930 [compost metagenome]
MFVIPYNPGLISREENRSQRNRQNKAIDYPGHDQEFYRLSHQDKDQCGNQDKSDDHFILISVDFRTK